MAHAMAAGNWKMNTDLAGAEALARGLRSSVDGVEGIETVLCPPFPYLALVKDCLGGSTIRVGAQNMHHETRGAFTGEVSPGMLAELCSYVIVGHSERRHVFGETDAAVNLKVRAALEAGLRPIVCVGETLPQREAGQASAVVRGQLTAALDGVFDPSSLSVAYEPVWAIGTGVAATPDTAVEIMGGVILEALVALYGQPAADGISLLYGGSVTAANVEEFVSLDCVHGTLVGGASLRVEEFAEIVRVTARVKAG
jgi:triosephosphate isomerase